MEELHRALPWLFESLRSILPRSLHPMIDPVLIIVAVTLVGVLLRILPLRWLERYTARTNVVYDDAIIRAVRPRLIFWFFLGSILLALPEMPLVSKVRSLTETIVYALFVISVTIAASNAAASIVSGVADSRESGLGGTTLIKYILRFFIFAIGLVSLLTLFEISIVPYVTALGVGGLAVALAFQDTLANLFAGIYIMLSRQVRVGDFISLSTTEEGYVIDISWRTTEIRTLSNNVVIIPNKKLGDAIITNFHLIDSKMMVEMPVGVSYESDPYRVEEVLLEEGARAVGEVPGVVSDPAPVVRFREFGASSLQMVLLVYIDDYRHRHPARHEMMKRIHRRFREEKIEIPFPIQNVRLIEGAPGT